jgi:hypothetical protein
MITQNLVEENANLKQKIEESERDSVKKEKANRRLRREVEDLVVDNEDLQDQLEELDSQIRKLQEQCLNQIEAKGFLRAEDDDTVRQRVQRCMNKCRLWAKSYAVATRAHIKDDDRPLADSLFRSNLVPDELVSPYGLLSSKYATIAPGIVLHAVLVKSITEWIFREPFFCLTDKRIPKVASPGELLRVFQAFDSVYQNAQLHGKVAIPLTSLRS